MDLLQIADPAGIAFASQAVASGIAAVAVSRARAMGRKIRRIIVRTLITAGVVGAGVAACMFFTGS